MIDNWQRPVRCAVCKDVIFSKYSGEYTSCKCGAIAVDQTPYYERRIGDLRSFEEIGDNQ